MCRIYSRNHEHNIMTNERRRPLLNRNTRRPQCTALVMYWPAFNEPLGDEHVTNDINYSVNTGTDPVSVLKQSMIT